MLHTTIGNIGQLAIITSFVTALVAAFGYFKATQLTDLEQSTQWKKFARYAFILHGISVLAIIICLYGIIRNHYFEYHYAWSHSSKALPTYYMISCFWEGQEGSFLLWIFWHAVLGGILIYLNASKRKVETKSWETPVMAVFALVQAFLCSMILGVVIPFIDLKIGSTPFLLMKEALPDIPVWKMNPDFIPADGNGLNPLLQNYWMVIHPPTLFLGFALTLVPFAFVIAGLWQKRYTEWIRPALPWSLFGAMVLGVGILMGAIWAYETLNFGGYWNWDPVENAIFVPWLVWIAAIHTMIAYKNSHTALRSAMILVISVFLLILYATFLTRSGILGNASVHSFTDLGLSGQLLLYLIAFLVISVFILVIRWKNIPSDEKETTTYSREFWIFMGATVLCLSAFQIIFTTSIPVYNKIIEAFGFVSNIAMPTDQIGHFTKIQIWFFMVITILSGIGQYVWWNKIKKNETFYQKLLNPVLAALVLTVAVVFVAHISNGIYITLLFAGLFSIITNLTIIVSVIKGKVKLSGGAVTHIGVALMLLGILFSAGYSKVITQNSTGRVIFADDKTDNKENVENQVLWLNKTEPMDNFLMTYKGQRIEVRNMPGYIKKDMIELIEGDFRAIALKDIVQNDKTYYKKGDTLAVFPENTYYEVEYRDQTTGKMFTLFPRIQLNPKMGTAVSPDIKHEAKRDIYTHVTYAASLEEKEWSKVQRFTVAMGDTMFLNDFVAILSSVQRDTNPEEVQLGPNDAAVKAQIRVLDRNREVLIQPSYIIKDNMVRRKAETSEEMGLRVAFDNIDPKTGTFTFAVETSGRDYIVMKALEKPFINLLWIGSLVLVIGFTMATARRISEAKNG